MNKHIIDFFWHKGKPYLVTKELNSSHYQKEPLVGFKFNIKLKKKRLCPGTYSLLKWRYQECSEGKDLTGTGYRRCKVCEDKIGFKNAFLFNGNITNKDLREYLGQEHLVYLAQFPPDIIKVGTTSVLRKYDRLYEQDARIFAFIARATGFDIQSIERFISRELNLRESVSLRHKLKYLGLETMKDKAFNNIKVVSELVKKKLKGTEFEAWLLDEVELGELDAIGTGVDLSNVELLKKYTEVGGRVKTVRGRVVIFENNSELFAIDGKKLIGEVIEEPQQDIVLKGKNEQMGLI
ncbi:DUF2797 domain-containing protein [Candidatus Dojkabacteria bacterium]|nr:DUF2797 domain-containing protein [Candidatus Dojkabacteria bacterium]